MNEIESRVSRANARVGPDAARSHRPHAVGLVRAILPVRAAAGRLPRASPGPRDPAAARGRLAGVGLRGRARGGQDAGRG